MSEKRRDKKRRILRSGESQRQDGRYVYKYKDNQGNVHFAYSGRLDKNDPVPAGKKRDLSLREKEKLILQDLFDGIISDGGNMTVLELVKKNIATKTGVRHNTLANYIFIINIIKAEAFGQMRINKVKMSDAKTWLINLQKDGRGYSTIHAVRGVVRPAFEMAVADDLIRKNPFSFQLASVVVNDSVTRDAISRKEERAFLLFIHSDKHFCQYYDGIYILFHTGLRISEFCGLTVSDVDFSKMQIRVDHQLQRTRNMEYMIEDTKTESGERFVPTTQEVAACFRRVIANRRAPDVEPMIDGRVGFLFLDKNNMPTVALHWEHYFKRILDKYNSIYKVQMPKVTPHVCRHTFCSNMAKSGMNPKTLQYIMGHSDISVTLNVYSHVDFEDAQAEMEHISKLKIAE